MLISSFKNEYGENIVTEVGRGKKDKKTSNKYNYYNLKHGIIISNKTPNIINTWM